MLSKVALYKFTIPYFVNIKLACQCQLIYELSIIGQDNSTPNPQLLYQPVVLLGCADGDAQGAFAAWGA